MLKRLSVKNYKSIDALELELGRVNVFIGENGCGKSNLLEAIALAGAAEANKLDNEFLTSRGIRVTEPILMRSRFTDENVNGTIDIEVNYTDDKVKNIVFNLSNDNQAYSKWTYKTDAIAELLLPFDDSEIEHLNLTIQNYKKFIESTLTDNAISDALKLKVRKTVKESINKFIQNQLKERLDRKKDLRLSSFIIYSPENSALRTFSREGQIEPLGINGEGLLKLLKVMNENDSESIKKIDSYLKLFNWYSSFAIPKEICEQDDGIVIKDKYLKTALIDQKSANEGFLFVLFYISLIVSSDTPKIFAIDNIDASLNPKLCTKIIEEISNLTKVYQKQILLTTHNPAILDGLDLNDPEQRLFVVSRNVRTGATRVKRITMDDKPKSSTGEALKLSEAMLRGYLGGLPKGF
ncbi:AAA family ATPase [Shewanella glacialipiscicola]|uniref:AAA family ATPase n=1 Tax=Shewanella glacialipiscicola TaxID=614069 RepID=UPI003D7B2D63